MANTLFVVSFGDYLSAKPKEGLSCLVKSIDNDRCLYTRQLQNAKVFDSREDALDAIKTLQSPKILIGEEIEENYKRPPQPPGGTMFQVGYGKKGRYLL